MQFQNQTTGKNRAWMVTYFSLHPASVMKGQDSLVSCFDWLNDCKVLNSNAWTLQVTQHEMRWNGKINMNSEYHTFGRRESWPIQRTVLACVWRDRGKSWKTHVRTSMRCAVSSLQQYHYTILLCTEWLLNAKSPFFGNISKVCYQSVIQLNRI
jgi:hypothetical protein